MSMPTRSAKRNVPVLGQPMAAPVSASTSSMVSPCSSIRFAALNITETPMRLAIKLGVSLASTTCLPSVRSAKRQRQPPRSRHCPPWESPQAAALAWRVKEVRPEETLSVRGKPGGNLCDRQSGGVGGQNGVGRKVEYNARQQGRLDGQISATASITQSHCASLGRSSRNCRG